MINAALKHTASVSVSSDSDHMSTDCVDDELSVGRLQVVETLLDDVIAVEVLNEGDDLTIKSFGDHLNLLRGRDEFDHLLQGPSAMLIESNSDHLRRGAADELGALVIIGIFQKLLAEVVAEGVLIQSAVSKRNHFGRSYQS